MSYFSEKNKICREIINDNDLKIRFHNLLKYIEDRKNGLTAIIPNYDQIVTKFKDEIETVRQYEKGSQEAYSCCKSWYDAIIKDPNIAVWKDNDKSYYFCTKNLLFKTTGKTTTTKGITQLPVKYKFGSDGDIKAWIILTKDSNTHSWSPDQNKIENILIKEGKKVTEYKSEKFCPIYIVLEEKYMGQPKNYLTDESDKAGRLTVEQLINNRLNSFKDYVINEFEPKL